MFSSPALRTVDSAKLFDNAPSPYLILDRDMHVVGVNRAYLEATQRSRADLVGRLIFEAFPRPDAPESEHLLRDSCATVFATGGPDHIRVISYPLTTADGARSERFWSVTHTPIFDNDGRVSLVLQQATDITLRHRAELTALENEARYFQMAQAMPNHVWTCRADGHGDWFNDRFTDYVGPEAATNATETWLETIHPDDRPRVMEAWTRALANGDIYECEVRFRRRDGAWRWHLSRAVPFKDVRGRVLRWIGSNTDIDDLKAVEAELALLNATLEQRVLERTAELVRTQEVLRQSQKMEAVGQLAGGIAHDFNNLLQVIGGNLQLLERAVGGEANALRLANNAQAGVTRGAKLASQLLAFSRRQPLAPKVVNLGRLARAMDHLIRRSVGEAVELETIIAPDLWNTVVDPANFESACLNLAINARDAMQGVGRLRIEIANAARDDLAAGDEFVMLCVSDTGCGMTPDVATRAFEPFFTTKPEGKGTGLGLSMVYGLVKQLGGHIEIASAPGKGATIRIYLPRSHDAEETPSPAAQDAAFGGSATVLIAEDDPNVRETAAGLIAELGYRPLVARDAASAIEIIESAAEIDLLFTDVVMPGALNGVGLARKAQELRPGLAVLFASGYAEDSIMHDGQIDPAVNLLGKPYSLCQLARAIQHALNAGAGQPSAAPQVTALLAEDDMMISMSAASALADLGVNVIEAASGAQAFAAFDSDRIDFLIADIGLPDISGLELARQARARFPDLPIVFATGRRGDPEIESFERSRMLHKPYDEAQLARAVAWARENR